MMNAAKETEKGNEMRIYTDTDKAEEIMKHRNRAAKRDGGEITVLVDGPAENEVTVMTLREAIDLGTGYRWQF